MKFDINGPHLQNDKSIVQRNSARHHNVWRNCGLLLVLQLVMTLVGCSANTPTETAAASADKNTSIKQLLDTAHSTNLEQRAPYLRDAAALALQQNNLDQAQHILQELDALKLTTAQRAQSKVLLARLQLKQHQPALALTVLQDRQLQQDAMQLTAREQIEISLLRAQALNDTHNYFGSVQELVFVEPLLKDDERTPNHQKIWQALTAMSLTEITNYRAKTENQPLRGWLELAEIAKRNAGNPTQQSIQLADWSRRWPTHPAAQNLPNELTQLRKTNTPTTTVASASTTQVKQVALLLPLSGKLAAFGTALRDGFMAAWYDNQSNGGKPPVIRLYDTDSSANVVQLYQQAVSDGAAIVIGPLEKQQVAQLYQQSLSVPTLALNRFESSGPAAANLYQYSLAAEDETAQIADIASSENHHSVLIIAPEDEMRSRELQAFEQRWRQRGGSVGAIAGYRDQQNMSQTIRNALNIPRSEARAKELESILNRNIEFTPHRRQDIDMVFILAKPAQARVIKPLLDFYYASDLTVYSTSRIYSGYAIPTLDRDLDKVRFTEMPFVAQNPALKQQILSAQPQGKNYLRLYAMGIDSFNLLPRLLAPNEFTGNALNGQTGQLTINSDRVIQRESLLAVMQNGNLVATAISANGDNLPPLTETALKPGNLNPAPQSLPIDASPASEARSVEQPSDSAADETSE